jgi:hypothetical protein
MLTIHITGTNQDELQKAAFVIAQLFETVTRNESNETLTVSLVAQNIPGNAALSAMLKTAEWQTARDEIFNLYKQPIVTRDTLKRLNDAIEDGSQLACDLEDANERISKEVSDALKELERIESAAVGYILKADHPALQAE